MKKIAGFLFLLAGTWMLIAPQANIGLAELRWMGKFVFPGEPLLGMGLVALAYYLLDISPTKPKWTAR